MEFLHFNDKTLYYSLNKTYCYLIRDWELGTEKSSKLTKSPRFFFQFFYEWYQNIYIYHPLPTSDSNILGFFEAGSQTFKSTLSPSLNSSVSGFTVIVLAISMPSLFSLCGSWTRMFVTMACVVVSFLGVTFLSRTVLCPQHGSSSSNAVVLSFWKITSFSWLMLLNVICRKRAQV